MAGEAVQKRRRFLQGVLGAAVTSFFVPIVYGMGRFFSFEGSPIAGASLKMSAADLTPDAPSKLIEIGGEPVIVVRAVDNSVHAYTATCPHLGCVVTYQAENPGFFCKCHNGKFDAKGVNLPGSKPQEPLKELVLKSQADDLEVFLTPIKQA